MAQIKIKLTNELLEQVISAVSERTGNVVGQKQINMIESRLTKRAMTLGLKDETAYLEYFKANRVSELEDLISILTVHHTYFFREFGQFEFLGTQVLPQLVADMKKEGRNKIRIWSAACSRGQEAYSLFMFVDNYLKTNSIDFSLEIIGTDVDRESVKIAANGVYLWDEVKEIPMNLLSRYWSRGTGEISKFAKIKDAARKSCIFKQSNLMETTNFSAHGKFDIIFCRNVFIYFQSSDVSRIAEALALQLNPKGFFFVGLSESLSAVPKGLKKRGPSIYGPEVVIQPAKSTQPTPAVVERPIRVVCVDDSATILKLLGSILTKDKGFEIVGTAKDGLEAAKLVEGGLQFDVMTLDVHMPNMTGVEYLEKKVSAAHPPIVMLTSASRDNMDLAYKAMALGAKDYIEKPSLNDLAKRSDEIRSKLRLIGQVKTTEKSKKEGLAFEKKFKSDLSIKRSDDKINIVFATERNAPAVLTVLKDRLFSEVPCVVVNIGEDKSAGDKFLEKLKGDKAIYDRIAPLGASAAEKKIYFASLAEFKKYSLSLCSNRAICYGVLSNISRVQWETCPKSKNMKILIEEEIDRSVFLNYLSAIFVTPSTSFAYMSNEFFGQTDQKLAS